MTRGAKAALWSGAGLLGVLVVLVLAVFIIANTDGGRAFIARETSTLTHGQVRLEGLHGSFPAALELDRLELRDSRGLWLWAEHLRLRWSPSGLLARHVEVDSLHLGLLHVERLPVPNSSSSSRSSSIPHTDVKALGIDTLELGPALAGAPTSLTVNATAHIRSLEDADAHVNIKRIAGDGDYEVAAHFDPSAMNATLQLHEPAHGPLAHLIKIPDAGALFASASLKGPRNAEVLQLVVTAGPLQAHANGRIDLRGKAADLTYALTAPAMAPSAGLAWQSIELSGQLHGPFTRLNANGQLLIQALQVPGGARLTQLDAQLQGDKGSLSLQAGVAGLQIPGAAPRLFAGSRLTLTAAVRLDDPRRPLQLSIRHRLFTLDAKAVTAGAQSADLELRLPDLKPFSPLSGARIAGDAQLSAHVDYAPASTKVTANLQSHLNGGDAAWSGLVRGGLTQLQTVVAISDQDLEVKSLRLTASALSLTAHGSAARTGKQQVEAGFELTLPNLSRASPALAGDATVTGTVEGPRTRLSADTRLTTSLSVRGSPRGTLTARVQAQDLPQSPHGTLQAAGQLDGAPLQVDVEVQAAGKAGYHALIRRAQWRSAHAAGDVTAGASVADARGAAQFQIADLNDFSKLAGRPLSGSVSGQLALRQQAGRAQTRLDIAARNIATGGITGNATLHVAGPLSALQVDLEADSPAVAGSPARIRAASVLDLTTRELDLGTLQATYHDQTLQLLEPATLNFAQGLRIGHLNLGLQQARIEVDGEVSPALDVRASVKQVDAKLINAFVPDLLASGTVEGEAAIRGTTSAPTGTVHLQALNVRARNVAAQGLPPTDLRADARLDGDTAQVNAHLTNGKSRLALTGKAPLSAAGSADLKLAGSLDLALANPLLEANGRHVAGTLAIDTTLTGSTAAPQIAGTVRLSGGSVRDYGQGISLTDINGVLSGEHGLLRIEQLTARAAPGTVSLEGTVGVLQPNIPVDIRLTARNAQPIASNIVTANLDADVHLSGAAREQLMIEGKVHLNRATISIPGGLPPEVAVLDVERDGVAAPPPAPTQPLVINLHLDVAAPNRILVNGRGLDAEMGGNLRIRGTTAAPLITGGFELQRGFFTLASSKLTFSSGSVTFNGTGVAKKLDPSLDFTAQSQVSGVTAIVHITGVADAPRIELTSTPDLPSDEILSRLLFGEPAADLTALQVVEMGAALASLRGGGTGPSLNPLARIQKALGLDRLSVGAAASTSASTAGSQQSAGYSIAAGRYVSNRVYVGVKQGTTGTSQVEVDVDLTKNLKLQAQLGNGTATAQGVTPENDPGSSLGLAYQFEY